jgi:Serine dehydrogenase proteinase
MPRTVYERVTEERFQTPRSRRALFGKIEPGLGNRSLVTYFTSTRFPVQIDDDDCEMLQSVLQQTDLSRGLVLMINSLGGDTIAAERIVNICRSYSGTGEYWAVVPGRAKSAATIICMGASKIIMAPPSELGPVDPQIIKEEDGETKWFSAFSLVSGYNDLFRDAVSTNGNVEPYVQQLAHYDIREINTYQGLIDVSKDIAIRILVTGMMKGATSDEVENRIKIFLDPRAGTQHHGRAIYANEARNCGLNIEELNVNSNQWKTIYELYYRTDRYVSLNVSKVVESRSEAFYIEVPS